MQPIRTNDLVDIVLSTIEQDGRAVIANHNLHSLYLYHRDEAFRAFYDGAEYVFIDGMPVIVAGRLLGYPLHRIDRITSVDWLRPVLRATAAHDVRWFFLGSKPGVAEIAVRRLREEIPGLEVQASDGYFAKLDVKETLRQISIFRPHVICVGMGMPRQEHWLLQYMPQIQANVFFNLGAFLDYVAGVQPTPPRWMSRIGLEGLARLVRNPRRLAGRYLLEPWYLLPFLIRDLRRGPDRDQTAVISPKSR